MDEFMEGSRVKQYSGHPVGQESLLFHFGADIDVDGNESIAVRAICRYAPPIDGDRCDLEKRRVAKRRSLPPRHSSR
jgi:hypothetical protein